MILIFERSNLIQDDPPVAEDDEKKVKPTDDISSWDAKFLQVDQKTLFQIIQVRNLNLTYYCNEERNLTDEVSNDVWKEFSDVEFHAMPKIQAISIVFIF